MHQKLQFATLFLAASVAAVAQTPNASNSSIRFYRQGNEWIQEIMLATRPYGATPIAGAPAPRSSSFTPMKAQMTPRPAFR